MADEFNNQNPNPNYGATPGAAPASEMNPNLKYALISGGVFYFGVLLCSFVPSLGAIFMLAGLVAMIVFMVKYIQDVSRQPNTGYISTGTHVALTLLTSGIWAIYWYYRTTKFFKENVFGYTKDPQTETLLCALVPYYNIYWAYKTGETVEAMAASKGIQKDVKVVALLLGLFTYWFGPVIYLQMMLNEVVGSPVMGAPIPQNQPVYQAAQPTYQAPQATYQAPQATYQAPQANYQAAGAQPNYQAAPQPQANATVPGFRPVAEHVLLCIFTCGIYCLYWIYKETDWLRQNVPGYTKDPTTETLLCLFVPYYEIYWTYKAGEALEFMANSRGMQKDIKTISLLLAIFFYFAGPAIYLQLMQNDIVAAVPGAAPQYAAPQYAAPQPQAAPQYAAPVAPQYAAPQAPQAAAPVDATEALVKYKELLDSGIITQEEFDAKKKELLGL